MEEKSKTFFEEVLPGSVVLLERGSITSGRPDACIYEWNGKSIYVEIIATKGNVYRDLVNLLNSEADISIAVLIDKEIDESVQLEFHSKSKNKFPWFNISEFLLEAKRGKALNKLQELLETKKNFVEEADVDEAKFKELCQDTHIKERFELKMCVGIFSHKRLRMYDKESGVDLHIGFQKYQLSEVVQPTVIVGSSLFPVDCGFENSPDIYFDKTRHKEFQGYCSKVLIHRDGKLVKIVHTIPLLEDKLFYIENFKHNFLSFIPFAHWIFTDKGMLESDNVDIWVYIKGLKDRVIVLPREPENIGYAMLAEKIYTDQFCKKMGTYSMKKINDANFYSEFEKDLIVFLKQYAK